MKRVISMILIIVMILCAAFSVSAHTPSSGTYQSADDTGIYVIDFESSHANIKRYSSHTLRAEVDLKSTIRSVCAYRGKIVLLCEDVKRDQLSVYVYDLDTDYLEGFAINNALLYNNTDFACDNRGIYLENRKDNHELIVFSYDGEYLGRHRFNEPINALFGGFHSGIYAVCGDTLYQLSSDHFTSIKGSSIETPVFPADNHVLISGYGQVYLFDNNKLSKAFSVDCDSREASACVIDRTLYFPNGNIINAYDLDTGEKIAYYRASFDIVSVFADGDTVLAANEEESIAVAIDDFTLLYTPEEDGSNAGENQKDPDDGSSSQNNQTHHQAEAESDISSNLYEVDFDRYYISGISPQTTVATFRKNMNYPGYSLSVFRNNNEKKSGNVGTAMTAVFTSDDVIYTFELAVNGDLTGEGNRNSRDLNVLMDYLIGTADFNGVYSVAADLSDDGKVDVCDLAYLKSMV